MFIRPWLEALKSRWMPGKRRNPQRLSQTTLQSKVETLEEKVVLSAFDLVTVIPNQGVFLTDGATMSEAPREVTLRFSPGQTITQNSLGAITVVRSGLDGVFDDASTPAVESTDDVGVSLGYVGLGDNPNEVIVRFASTLVDDEYQIRIQATGPNALQSTTGDTFNTGVDDTFNINLDLGAQVEAVVPQPVIRSQVFTVANSATSLANGDVLTVTNGPYTTILEFNTAPGNVLPGHVYVSRTGGDAAVATAIANALNGLGLPAEVALTATVASQTVTITGSAYEPTVTFGNPVLTVTSPTSITDGDQLVLTLGATTLRFEFNDTDVNNVVTSGYSRINFARSAVTQATINTAIEAAIDSLLNNPTQAIQANLSGSSIVFTGTTGTPGVFLKTASSAAFARSNTSQALSKTVVNVANAMNLSDADTLTLSLNGSTLIFEFNNLSVNNLVTPGRIRINYTNGATEATIASAINSAVNSVANNPAQAIRAILVGNSVAITGTTGTPAAAWTTALPGVFTQDLGSLSQATDKVVVYFNQDQLNSTLAIDPTYYRLVNVANGTVLLPSSVNYQYNATTGLSAAVLTFSSSLANASYNLKVGVSTEPNGLLADAINVGTLFTTQEFDRNEYLGDGSGSSIDGTDTDLYRFTLATAGTVTFTLDSGATLDGIITFLDSTGTPVGAPVNAMGLGGQETLTTGVLGAGTFYVRVSSASSTTGSYRLRISTAATVGGTDDNSSFQTSTNLGDLGEGGLFTSAQIEAQGAFVTMPQLPGGSDEPGHRELPPGAFTGFSAPELGHGTGTDADPSAPAPTAEITYSFPVTYDGSAAGLGTLLNEITPEQKEIIRMIFQIYSYEVGAQFREVASGGMGIVVGDLRAAAPQLPPPGPAGISGNPIILNSIFYANENEYGGGFTSTAFHEIGHNLGLGHSYDLPSIQGGGPTAGPVESVFTGDHDLTHLLRSLPNNSSDIDLYRFNVTETGTLSAETIAERLGVSNLLNSVLTLYREDGGTRTVVARNDDFFSKDAGLEVPVTPGVYYIGVTSSGNDNYDPTISNSGFGGRSRGTYQLKLDFKPTAAAVNGLEDTTGQLLDGDHNGQAGGEYNAWFNVAPTIIVDKLAPAGGTGTLASPYNTISAGLAAATAGDIVRIVGNGGADRDAATTGDNVPYAIGRDYDVAQSPLADGATFQVPADVTVVIDAGALIKLRGETVDVGTSSAGIDRSNGALQVLGTPVNNVTFTSWRDDAKGSIDDGTNGAAAGADWGGIVFRQDSDSAVAGAYLNIVNHATLQYGGGQVSVDGGPLRVYNVIDLETSRPTITNNIIQNNADAAISANPDSFKADDGRIGPDIHGNLVTQNSTNGLFVRIQTGLGSSSELLNVIARFDDTDITHVITQNLILNGRPGGALSNPVSARLMIDPGTIVKLSGARIESGVGYSNLIAEGTSEDPIRFTSQQDDRFGTGGTFDVKNDGNTTPTAGNWSGFFVAQTSTASFDNVSITYAGGASEIGGNTDYFNPIETLQGRLRVTNSLFQNNAGGAAATSRGGRGGNDNSTIFVRGAQPILVNNAFKDNVGNVVSINANSMQAVIKTDYGRSTGLVNDFEQFDDNYGPLVRLNKFDNSATFASGSTLGMNVRGEELTIESVWDDTDIAHVVRSAVVSNEFHTYGGLTLKSSTTGSLVVKLQGATAGFVATGDPLEITDRIGGTVQVIGQPGFPVILTSLLDDTVSAGFKANGFPQFDTNGDNNAGGASTGSPGDWDSLSFDQYSNDTNVAYVTETEPALNQGNDINGGVGNPQPLGNLAPNLNSGDENRRLGFEVHGFISPDSPGDVDVYSFTANPGTEVWIDTDFTSQRLDVMVELLNSAGTVLARSLNSQDELANQAAWLSTYAGTLAGTPGNSNLNPLVRDRTLGTDFYTSNFHDAGFRAVLPGNPGTPVTFFVRVRSQPTAGTETNAIPPGGNGLTSGNYQLQVRLQQVDEIPGSTVRYADIRFATNGIELHGLPAHSPLMGEAAETGGDNDGANGGQYLGQLLQQDRNTLSVSGNLQSATDVDFYRFSVDYSQVQVAIPGPKMFPTIFDLDWADGLTRPDTVIAVFNSNFNLIYVGRESDIADDQPAPGQGQDLDDLTRSTIGRLDPYIGTANLLATASQGAQPTTTTNYYVAVFSNGVLPTALTANFNAAASPETQLVRLEPINSIRRVVEDHVGYTGYQSQATLFGGTSVQPTNGPMFNVQDEISLATNIRPFTLSDVNLYVTSNASLFIVDPFYGTTEVDYANYGDQRFNDLDMRSDGRLYGLRYDGNGTLVELNPGSGAELSAAGSGIAVKDGNNNNPFREQENGDGNANTNEATAITFRRNNFSSYDVLWYAITSDDLAASTPGGISKLYRATTAGSAAYAGSSTGAVGMITDAPDATRTIVTPTTGMQYVRGSGQLYGVSQAGQLYRINDGLVSPSNAGGNPGNGISQALAFNVIDYSAALGAIGAGSGFTGLADAPQNVENGAYSDYLFATTNNGSIVCIDPSDPNPNTALQAIFDSDFNGIADSARLSTGVGNPTGLAFSPIDFNLWHTTQRRGVEAGHGINRTDTALVDNSRVPASEAVNYQLGSEGFIGSEASGNASMYFGLETWAANTTLNYAEYESTGQLGVLTEAAHRDFTGNPLLQNSYNVPGGAYGSLVTNSFSLEGYSATDKPTLYFNYWLETQGAAGKTEDSMRDSARVYVSVDNGETWTLAATNNSTPSAPLIPDAELPAYLSTNRNASFKGNQGVQELFDTASWRQARIDLNDFVGATQIKLRFDFSTSGRSGTVIDVNTGLRVASNDVTNPTYADDTGGSNGLDGTGDMASAGQNNAFEGFYVDDIIVGFAGRGEMVTSAANGAATTNINGNPFTQLTKDPDPNAAQQLLSGNYQLEIRRGEDYSVLVDPPTPLGLIIVNPTLDINDRLTNGQTVQVGNNVQDTNSVTVYNGLITRTFEFNSIGGVSPGNIAVSISGTPGGNAANLAAAITTAFAGTNTVIANAVSPGTNSDRVDIFGAVSVTAVGTPPPVTALGAETDSSVLGWGNDYPISGGFPFQVANIMGAFSAGIDGYYSLTGEIGNSEQSQPDSDFFEVSMTSGQTLTVDLTVTGGTGTNYVLGILDSSFNILAFASNGSINFTATATQTYYVGVLGDDGNALTSPIDPAFGGPPDPLASAGNDTFLYTLDLSLAAAGSGLPVALAVDSYVRQGDDNLERTQGQFIIENNTILNASNDGVLIDDNERVGTVPHPGAPINTSPQNTQRLLTGVYVQNNVIARSGANGIEITGDPNNAQGPSAVPFVKVVNNTLVGATGGATQGTGIRVANNASPTLMNNVLVNLVTGIQIDVSSGSTEVEANLFQGNNSDGTLGNNALFGADTAGRQLFVNPATNNFYPAASIPGANNPIVDSSRNNFNDRAAYIAATGPLGIPPSPILAPNFDRFGQLRVDDPASPGPSNQPGLGQNPFQDRGALERADFDGGVVIPVVPQDNDGAGIDYDPALNTIWIDAANPVAPFSIQTQFVLQLIDNGIGIDDDSVDTDGSDFLLVRNGTPLVQGLDYFFTYNRNTNEAIFTSVSTFSLDTRYQIVVNAAGITDYAGNVLQNNQAQPIDPVNPQILAPFDSSLLYFNYIVTDGENDAPVTTAPSAVSMSEDTTFTFNASNLITVADEDAFLAIDGDPNMGPEGGRIQVTVYVPDARGSITSGSTVNLLANGGSFIGTGTASDPFVINGRIIDINEALANLQYTPPANFPMTNTPQDVLLTVFCEDLGKFGPPAPGTTDPQTSTQVVTITVNPVNDPPTLGLLSPVTVLEDSGTTNVPLAGISAGGGETQALTVTVTSSDTSLFPVGSMVVNYTSPNATGSIDFTPAPNRFGTANITVLVRDNGLDGVAGNGDDATTSRVFAFTVTGVNDAPVFGNVVDQTVLEDSGTTVVNLTGIAVGPFETQNLTFTAVSSDPTIVPNPVVSYTQGSSVGTLSFTPVANRNGVVTITLTVMDDGGTANSGVDSYFQTFTITVTAVNDAPTLTPIPNATLPEDAGLQTVNLSGISAGPSDESGQTVSITATSNNQTLIPDGNIVVTYVSGNPTGTLTYTPAAEQFGTATITVTVTDNGGNLNGGVSVLVRTFTVTINSVNDAPTLDLIADPAPISEDAGLQTINLTGITAGPPNESSQSLTVTAVSSVPGLIPNPTVTYTSPNATGTLTYTPVANMSGTAVITVTVTDNGGIANGGINTFVRTFNVVVNPVNDTPTLNPIPNPAAILEDAVTQTVNLTGITAGPLESQALEVTATSSNTALIPNGNISVNYTSPNSTGSVSYTPAANENGSATITVTVRDAGLNNTLGDGDDGFTTQTFDVVVTAVNDAPTLDPIGDITIDEDSPLQTVNLSGISVGPTNEVGQNLVLTAVSSNTALILNSSISVNYTSANPTGTISFTPQPNANGTATITVTLTDNGGTLNSGSNVVVRTFTVTVTPVPDTPTNIVLSSNLVFENRPAGTVVGTFSTTDIDLPADSFTYSLVSGTDSTDNGSFQIVGNQLQTAQSFNFEAKSSYSIRVRTLDSFGLTFEKVFAVQIVNLNDAPTLNVISDVSFAEDSGPQVVNLSGITAGGDSGQILTVTATSSDPTVIANPVPVTYTSPSTTGSLTLTPLPNQNGTVTITVTVTDDGGTANGGINTVIRTFLVTVTAVNDAPTDINLSNDTIPEIPAGTLLPANVLVGQLTSVDPDLGDTFQYQLVSGPGGTDNASFQIVNDQLFALGPIDFDMQPDYSIRVRTTDTAGTGLSFDKVLEIHATNVNEPATGIGTQPNPISGVPNSIPENRPAGSVVGTLEAADPDEGDVTTFALVAGAGATDNALFSIVNGQLIANQTFNFEFKNSYTVRIRATDSQNLVFETPVVISITNVNEAPTNINLSNSTVVENTPAGTPVGDFSTIDIDANDTFTYTLVSGTGSTDNARFTIVNNQLVVAVPPNYEDNTGHFYSVRVRSTDAGGISVEKSFTITITDVNEAPTALTLTPTSVNENRPVGTVVGTFSTADQDIPETFTYALVSGVGSTDNAAFTISGNQLLTAMVFDFETKTTYNIRVRTTDSASQSFEQVLTVTINNTFDGPVITLADPPLTTTGRKPVVIDPAALLTDIDSTIMDGGRLVVAIQAGEQTGDVLGIHKDTSTGMVLKAVRGKTILRLGKQDIATISGGVRGIPLTIQFGAGISKELFQTVMRNINFRGKPFAAPRVISMQAFDETGIGSNIETRNINVL